MVTTYSKTLDKKGSLDIGLKLLKTVSSKPGFLSTGVTSAIFSPGCRQHDNAFIEVQQHESQLQTDSDFDNNPAIVSFCHVAPALLL